jgi:hypothetical protein
MKNFKWGKVFVHLKCTTLASIVITQMPLNLSKLAIRTQNESKGSYHLNYTKSKPQ